MRRILALSMCLLLLSGCTYRLHTPATVPGESVLPSETDPAPTESVPTEPVPTETVPEVTVPVEPAPTEPAPTEPAPTEPAPTEPIVKPDPDMLTVVIDPGHQSRGNYDKEPVGPGATELKAKVSSGTQGCVTRIPEYQLTLTVSFLLREILESRGYHVVMTRESHDVNISNSERAAIANAIPADAFVRIHANGSTDSTRNGAMTICQTRYNPYNADIYTQSKALSVAVLDALVAEAGCRRETVWETDTMSGINWCRIPVTIVEMGYMSCPEEDRLLNTPEYQLKLATGIANGIDAFFGK